MKKAETIIGVDYGDSYIGLALGREGVVAPLAIVPSKNHVQAINEILRYSIENKAMRIIVGLPLTPDGKETQQSIKVRSFVKLMKVRIKTPIEYVDESFTTQETSNKLAVVFGNDIYTTGKRTRDDDLAAALILKRYYERED